MGEGKSSMLRDRTGGEGEARPGVRGAGGMQFHLGERRLWGPQDTHDRRFERRGKLLAEQHTVNTRIQVIELQKILQ